MFISFDNGAHWQPFQLNLPNVPINDIKVHKKDLVIATQGRACLDPRQPDAAASDHAGGGAAAGDAVQAARRVPGPFGWARRWWRTWWPGRRRGRGGSDPSAAQYSPPGGLIYYQLASVPAAGVRIDISDSAGKPVAAFSSEGSVALASGGAVAAAPTNSDDPGAAAAMAVSGGRGRGGGGAPARGPVQECWYEQILLGLRESGEHDAGPAGIVHA